MKGMRERIKNAPDVAEAQALMRMVKTAEGVMYPKAYVKRCQQALIKRQKQGNK